MLTKNFYNLCMAMGADVSVTNGFTLYDGTVYGTPIASAARFIPFEAINTLSITAISSTSSSVKIGSGTTPPKPGDITLENPITSGVSVVNPSAPVVSTETDHIKVSATYGVTNTGTTAITISEIGLFGTPGYNSSGQSVSGGVLFDRTVLEDPIVINPGESKQITYTIRFNYPTA